jgi:hypothetical protein
VLSLPIVVKFYAITKLQLFGRLVNSRPFLEGRENQIFSRSVVIDNIKVQIMKIEDLQHKIKKILLTCGQIRDTGDSCPKTILSARLSSSGNRKTGTPVSINGKDFLKHYKLFSHEKLCIIIFVNHGGRLHKVAKPAGTGAGNIRRQPHRTGKDTVPLQK